MHREICQNNHKEIFKTYIFITDTKSFDSLFRRFQNKEDYGL